MVGSVTFKGPCKSPITLHIEGKLKAPVELERLSSQDGWIVFQDIDGLQVSGGGTFDGQGSAAWAKNDCRKTGKCSSLPIVSICHYHTHCFRIFFFFKLMLMLMQ